MGQTLSEKAMRVKIKSSQWYQHKADKAAGEEITRIKNAEAKAARVTKKLVPDAMKRLDSADRHIDAYFKEHTAPWGDDGTRILLSKKFMDFSKGLQGLFEKRKLAADQVVIDFLQHKQMDKDRLGDMYREEDYPDIHDLPEKFSVDVEFSPLPDSNDFRVDLADEELEKLRTDYEARNQAKMDAAMLDVWQKLYAPVAHMAKILGNGKKVEKSVVENVLKITELLPALNVADDPELEAMRSEIEGTLCDYSAAELRESEYVRGEKLESAKELMEKMEGYI